MVVSETYGCLLTATANVAVAQGQLVYMAYNDFDMAERLLSHALQMEPAHLLARMHLDLVRSLRRAAALLSYQPFVSNPPYAQATVTPIPAAVWDQVFRRVCACIACVLACGSVRVVLRGRLCVHAHASWHGQDDMKHFSD